MALIWGGQAHRYRPIKLCWQQAWYRFWLHCWPPTARKLKRLYKDKPLPAFKTMLK